MSSTPIVWSRFLLGSCRIINSNLSYLSISTGFFTTADTQMTGEILQYFEGRTELQILGVGENSFVGTIPTFFGEFASLEVLSLLGNSFSGTIPTQLGNLNNLGRSHLVFPLCFCFCRLLLPHIFSLQLRREPFFALQFFRGIYAK